MMTVPKTLMVMDGVTLHLHRTTMQLLVQTVMTQTSYLHQTLTLMVTVCLYVMTVMI